jgi:hypothetical protein
MHDRTAHLRTMLKHAACTWLPSAGFCDASAAALYKVGGLYCVCVCVCALRLKASSTDFSVFLETANVWICDIWVFFLS